MTCLGNFNDFQSLREGSPVLWGAEREHTHVLCARILRESRSETMVGAVQNVAMARHIGPVY